MLSLLKVQYPKIRGRLYLKARVAAPVGDVKGTYSKTARGEMVRFMAENNIQNYENLKKFNYFGYVFREDLSSEKEYIFERT